MKRTFVLLIMLLSFCAYSTAQSNYTEVVYLKNGSIIRGVVVEQVPNVSLKIKTADGSIFVYPMNDVEKITKEESRNTRAENAYRAKKQPSSSLRGYKGFVDAGYIFDVSDSDASKFEVTTSHGYQFNNYFYVGGGMSINHYPVEGYTSVPLFANFRANFSNKKITPFGDFKIGYSTGDVSGTYVSTAIGVRFGMTRRTALNVQLEYSFQGYDDDYYKYGSIYYIEEGTANGFGLKVGFEF